MILKRLFCRISLLFSGFMIASLLFPSDCDFRMSGKGFSYPSSFSSARPQSLLEAFDGRVDARRFVAGARSEIRSGDGVPTVFIENRHFAGIAIGPGTRSRSFIFQLNHRGPSGELAVTRTVIGTWIQENYSIKISWYWLEDGELSVAAEPTNLPSHHIVFAPPAILENGDPVLHVVTWSTGSGLPAQGLLSFSRIIPQLVPKKGASGFNLDIQVKDPILGGIPASGDWMSAEWVPISFFCERRPDGKGWIGRVATRRILNYGSEQSVSGVEVFLPDRGVQYEPDSTRYVSIDSAVSMFIDVCYVPGPKDGMQGDYWILRMKEKGKQPGATQTTAADENDMRYILAQYRQDTRPHMDGAYSCVNNFTVSLTDLPGKRYSKVMELAIAPPNQTPVFLVQGRADDQGWMVWLDKEGKVQHIVDFSQASSLKGWRIISAEKVPGNNGFWAIRFASVGWGVSSRVVVIDSEELKPWPLGGVSGQLREEVKGAHRNSTPAINIPFPWARNVFLSPCCRAEFDEVFLRVQSTKEGGTFFAKVLSDLSEGGARKLGEWRMGNPPESMEIDPAPTVTVLRESSGNSHVMDRPPGNFTGKLEIYAAESGTVVVDAPKDFTSSSQHYVDTWAAVDPGQLRVGIFQMDVTRMSGRLIFGQLRLQGAGVWRVDWDQDGWRKIQLPRGAPLFAGLVVLGGRFFVLNYLGEDENPYGKLVPAESVGKKVGDEMVSPFSLEMPGKVVLYGAGNKISNEVAQEVLRWAKMNPKNFQAVIVLDDRKQEFSDDLKGLPNVKIVLKSDVKAEGNARLLLYGKAVEFSSEALKWAEGFPVYVSGGFAQGFLSAVLLKDSPTDTPFERNSLGWKVLTSSHAEAVSKWFSDLCQANLAISLSA